MAATTDPVTVWIAPITGIKIAAPITDVEITPDATFARGPKSSRARL